MHYLLQNVLISQILCCDLLVLFICYYDSFAWSLLLLVLFNMVEYLSDFEVVGDDSEYDGCPYHFEPEYTDEELFEGRMQRQREDQLTKTAACPRIDGNRWSSRRITLANHSNKLVKLVEGGGVWIGLWLVF